MRIRQVINDLSLIERLIFMTGLSTTIILQKWNRYQKLKSKVQIKKTYPEHIPGSSKGELILESPLFPNKITLREAESDFDVFNQIFIKREYQPVIDLANTRRMKIQNIVDLGANIGLTSIFFNRTFPNSLIYALEPDHENYKQLQKNCQNTKKIIPINKGIWHKRVKLQLKNQGSDQSWTKTFIENGHLPTRADAITMYDILAYLKGKEIDILKIDIEGAEHHLFNESNQSLEFLKRVKIVVIEIHDKLANRNKIYSILKKFNFKYFNSGELTIAYSED